jgi:membrane-associated protein
MNVHVLIDFFLHLDKYLKYFIDSFGIGTYIILFFVIFMETGFVITPFLPGDSILFAVGTFSAIGLFKIFPVYILLLFAAFIGDTVNYWIGHSIGPKIFEKESRFIKKKYLDRTKLFYEKHGGKTIILARFIPIIRTFAPFIAGIGIMKYSKFLIYNLIGGFLWVSFFVFLGYFFGNIPLVKENFEITILIIVFISVIPVLIEVIKSKLSSK